MKKFDQTNESKPMSKNMNSRKVLNGWIAGATLVAALGVVGCGSKAPDPTPAPTPAATTPGPAASGTATTSADTSFIKASAGIPVPIALDPTALKNLTASMSVRPRKDPFSLRPAEQAFDLDQLAQRLNQEGGSPEIMYELPEEKDDTIQPEEQLPYRRLSGVLVGDSVLGILVTPGQEGGEILRPGQLVPGTEFRVVSIDQDRMILRREGNRRPKEVIVRLEQGDPLAATGGGAGAPAGIPGGPGNRRGGPGGFPGGPGGVPGGAGANNKE